RCRCAGRADRRSRGTASFGDDEPCARRRSPLMSLTDATGHRLSGATPTSLAHFEQAARELLCLVDDPVGSIDRAIEASPDMTMAHLLKAWLHLLGTEPGGLAVAKACC